MGLRWAFEGRDKYRETLLESTGAGLQTLVEFEQIRIPTPGPMPAPRPPLLAEPLPTGLGRMKAFEPFFRHSWDAQGETKSEWRSRAGGAAFHINTTFEWVPYANVIYTRVTTPIKDGESEHLLDAFIYHHSGANALRCLAFSKFGGVYEGDVAVIDGDSVQLDLKGYERDRTETLVVRCDFETDGKVRQRMWTISGTDRTMLLDVQHTKR